MIELYVNDQFVPIADGFDGVIAVTRKVADIAEPDTRSGDYTKQFVIPGIPETNKLFNHLFEVNTDIQNVSTENFTPDFNPNLKAEAVILVDDMVAFRGDLRLDNITLTRENKIEYHVEVFSKLRNFFNDIGESLMSEIDLSELEHLWNGGNIAASFTHEYGDGYVYPMIDYGTNTDKTYWEVTDFRPAVFAKWLWDKIFASVNWNYDSAFLATDDFEKLILVGNGSVPPRDQDAVTDDTFTVACTAGTQTLSPSSPSTPPTSVSGIFAWDTATGTVSSNLLKNTADSEFSLATEAYQPNENKGLMAFRFAFTSAVQYLNAATLTADETVVVTYIVTVSGPARGTTKVLDSFTAEYLLPTGTVQNGLSNTVNISHTTIEHEIFNDDRVQIRVFTALSDQFSPTTLTPATRFDIQISTDAIFGNIPRTELWVGETMTFDRFLPKDMKQRDFIMAFSRMFNLYFDQTEERTLLIEPRDGGYHLSGDDNVLVWTDKLDISQPYRIRPMGYLDTQRYFFGYKEGKDYMSQRYLFQFNENYGDRRFNVINDFQTAEKSIKLPFSTAVLANDPNLNDRILTHIQYFDDTGQPTEPTEELRVLYYGGAINTANTWYFKGLFITPSGVTSFTQYPYAGHLNNPNNPTADYLFRYPRAVYFDIQSGGTQATKYTSANLFARFYSQFIYEITDRNSRVFEGWFYIDLKTWTEVDFRKLYFIKDAYYRLLEISDYNLSGNALTFCRFLKTEFVAPLETEQVTLGGEFNWEHEDDPQPMIVRTKWRDINTTRSAIARNQGERNAVRGAQGIIRGNLNTIGGSAMGHALFNASGNQVVGKNTILLNTNGRYVGWDDQAWINDVNYENKLSFTVDSSIVNALDVTPYDILPALESNQYWEVTRVDFFYDHNGTNYTGGALIVESATSGVDLFDDSGNPVVAEGADLYAKMTDISDGNLTSRMGEGVRLTASPAISGSGGDISFVVYYRMVEI